MGKKKPQLLSWPDSSPTLSSIPCELHKLSTVNGTELKTCHRSLNTKITNTTEHVFLLITALYCDMFRFIIWQTKTTTITTMTAPHTTTKKKWKLKHKGTRGETKKKP
jgi:hypothetical protein